MTLKTTKQNSTKTLSSFCVVRWLPGTGPALKCGSCTHWDSLRENGFILCKQLSTGAIFLGRDGSWCPHSPLGARTLCAGLVRAATVSVLVHSAAFGIQCSLSSIPSGSYNLSTLLHSSLSPEERDLMKPGTECSEASSSPQVIQLSPPSWMGVMREWEKRCVVSIMCHVWPRFVVMRRAIPTHAPDFGFL